MSHGSTRMSQTRRGENTDGTTRWCGSGRRLVVRLNAKQTTGVCKAFETIDGDGGHFWPSLRRHSNPVNRNGSGAACSIIVTMQATHTPGVYTPFMAIPRLRPDQTALLVIDMQERLMPTIAQRERVTANAAILLRMAAVLGMPYMVTEQYPQGLGRTVDAVSRAMTDQSRRIEKTRFSACVELVHEQLLAWRRGTVIVCGVEAHVCVLQTSMDLLATGRQVFIVTDAVSASQSDQIPFAFERMTRAGAVLTGVMSAMYELLGDSTNPAFSACLEMAKAVAR